MATVCLLVIGSLLVAEVHAVEESDDVFVLVTQDEQAYIYNAGITGLSGGFHIERRPAGGEWQRITEEAVFPASDGFELERMTGELFPLLQDMTEEQASHQVFLRLMTSRQYGVIGTLIHPDIAKALGRLYIDENPPLFEEIEYRILVTNSRGEPTGETVSKTVLTEPQLPQAPEELSVSHQGNELLTEWEYPVRDVTDDGVARFRIYHREDGDEELLTDEDVLRRTDTEEQRRRIEVEELNREYEIFVVAVDAAGQESEPTESVTIVADDNIPPEPVLNVDLYRLDDQIIEISWPVSPDPDAVGYHVFRYEHEEDEDFVRVTDEQLDLTENVFRDTTITGSSHYNYKIRVYDEHGNESDPSNEVSMFIEEFEPPEPVTEVEAQLREDATVHVNWNESPTEDIGSYSIIRREIHPDYEESYSQVNEGRHIETEIADAGIAGVEFPEGRTFEYGVAAVGPSSMHSDTVKTTLHIPLTTPPEPPVNLEVTSAEAERVNIRWAASPSRTVTQYNVYRISGAEDVSVPEVGEVLQQEEYEEARIATEEVGTHFTRDENAETGQTYKYMVAAVDSAGNFSSPNVSEPFDHRSGRPPQPVRNLQAGEVDGEIKLRWEPVNTGDLEGYVIYRSSIATGSFEIIEEVENEQNEWADPNGEPGDWYRVRAVDSSGNKSRTTRASQAIQ